MAMPLEGVRVLDLTIWQQGPVATTALADMGAEVIKIERPPRGDPGRRFRWADDETAFVTYFECHNRNKKAIVIDLAKERGKEILYQLVEKSDVFVQNLRPGVVERLGVDYKTLSRVNPRIIYASATGWGSKGPDARKPCFDILAQARGGILSVIGEPEGPPPWIQINGAANWVGAVVMAYGIMVALFNREKTGLGQEVEVSLLGSQVWHGQLGFQRYLFSGQTPKRAPRKGLLNPLFNTYKTGDDRWIALGMVQPRRHWSNFCRALSLEQLENDPRFSTFEARTENKAELTSLLDEVFATRPAAEWTARLEERDIPCASAQDYQELAQDPQVLANDYVVDFDHPAVGPIRLVGIPVKLSKTPGAVRMAAPRLGEHTEEVLLQVCGYNPEDLAELRKQEVIV